ncbi:MAG: GNAT family N-acetyltransferase [Pseudomonadota bacterium]
MKNPFTAASQPFSFNPDASRISDYPNPDHLPDAARWLLAKEGQRRFFNGLSWYQIFCRTCLQQDQEPTFLYLSSPRGQVTLPLLTPLGRPGCRLSEKRLGQHSCMSMTNYQTAYYAPISDLPAEDLPAALEQLARHLKTRGLSVIDFNNLDSAIPANAALSGAFERAGFKVHNYDDEPVVFEQVEGLSYQDYLAKRSSNLRKNIKRRRRQIEKVGKVDFVLKKDPDAIEPLIGDYQKVQAASWKRPEVHCNHVPDLIRTAAQNGHLRLGLLYLDDQPVATDLTFLADGRATSKKAHYDQAMRNHHVGDVLTSFMFEHLLDVDNVKTIEPGKTAVSYKLKWTVDQRPMNGFVAFDSRTLKGQSWRLRFQAARRTRSLLSTIKSKIVTSGG